MSLVNKINLLCIQRQKKHKFNIIFWYLFGFFHDYFVLAGVGGKGRLTALGTFIRVHYIIEQRRKKRDDDTITIRILYIKGNFEVRLTHRFGYRALVFSPRNLRTKVPPPLGAPLCSTSKKFNMIMPCKEVRQKKKDNVLEPPGMVPQFYYYRVIRPYPALSNQKERHCVFWQLSSRPFLLLHRVGLFMIMLKTKRGIPRSALHNMKCFD